MSRRGGDKKHPDDDPTVLTLADGTELSEYDLDRMVREAGAEYEATLRRVTEMRPEPDYEEWLVTVPEYDDDGIHIERFTISEEEALVDKLRAAYNHQRPNRSIDPGTFTRLNVDGQVWMTDTPAEIRDHRAVDRAMAVCPTGTVLIAGLGLGVILHRALTKHRLIRIDVVDIDQRVLDAVGPHYLMMADRAGVELYLHHSDIHKWVIPADVGEWDVAWWDIWPTINDEDMTEVTRLNNRFRTRTRWRGAWAQDERIKMKQRIRSGKWAY